MTKKIFSRQTESIYSCMSILSQRDRRKFILASWLQASLGILDLIGVALIGLLGALALTGVQSRVPGDRVNFVLNFLQLADKPFQLQAAALAVFAAFVLVSRTLLSVFFAKSILYFLARKGAQLSQELTLKLMSVPLMKIQERSSQQNLYSVTTGVSNIAVVVLGTVVQLFSDGLLLLMISLGLFILDPALALSTFVFFGLLGLTLNTFTHKKAEILGSTLGELGVRSDQRIIEALTLFPEIFVRNKRREYAKEIGQLRLELADSQAELSFMPNVGKYVIEISVVIGALAIGATQFLLQDAVHAVSTLSVFLAAATRIAPAVLRIQQGLITIGSALGAAEPTLLLVSELKNLNPVEGSDLLPDFTYKGFEGTISLKNVSFSFPNQSKKVIDEISIEIEAGSFVAIVGNSGAGKTTLVNLILGLLEPDLGVIKISGLSSISAIQKWPGAIGYLPQEVILARDSIRKNVTLDFQDNKEFDDRVVASLRAAQIYDHIAALPAGIDSLVGDGGLKLSGGQKQRLGIARALYTNPKIIILDEATSALDAETEKALSHSVMNLRGSATVIVIAHRLSTVRNADLVVYLEKGRVSSMGTFDEVRKESPNFDKQAKLMGL